MAKTPLPAPPHSVDGWSFERTMKSSEVAGAFSVNIKTVARWRDIGLLVHFRTLGGHSRYSADQVEHLLAGGSGAPKEQTP